MNGEVFSVSDCLTDGMIKSSSGQFYSFTIVDWKGVRPPKVGNRITFSADGSRAHTVTPLASLYPEGVGSPKSRLTAALLAFFMGGAGGHKFYLGQVKQGVLLLLASTIGSFLLLPALVAGFVALYEAILYISMSDEQFTRTYVEGGKKWF